MSAAINSETVDNLVKKFNKIFAEHPTRFNRLVGVTPSWTPAKLVTLFREIQQEKKPSNGEIAALVDLDRTTISRKNSAMDWEKFAENLDYLCSATDEQLLQDEVNDEREKLVVKKEEKNHKTHITNLALMQHLEQKILTNVKSVPKVFIKPFIYVRKSKKTRTPEHMVVLLSDFHVGQEFSNRDTGDLNEYNVDLFLKRAEQLRRGVISIYEHHSELYNIPELNVFCLGDIVQGSNLGGEWGPAYNSTMDVAEQAVVASDAVCNMVSVWSNYFKKVNVLGVVGNHGRAGAAKNSDKVSANWDNAVYSLVKAKVQKTHANVHVDHTYSWWTIKNVNNTDFLLIHGDHIRSGVNGLLAEEQRLQSLVSKNANKRFHYVCMGHFHNSIELETSMGGILVNGSFVGGDIYSMHKMRHVSRPTQTVFGVHPNRGLTWKYKIDLDAK